MVFKMSAFAILVCLISISHVQQGVLCMSFVVYTTLRVFTLPVWEIMHIVCFRPQKSVQNVFLNQ